VKIREYRYCKHGNTHEDYQAFMQTNRNSFHLSIRLCILMVIFAVVDLLLLVLLTYLNANSFGALNASGELAEEASDTFVNLSLAVGIGKSWPIGLLAPFMLLFSYNKQPKKKIISLILPAVAVVLCIFIVLEATRMGVGMIMEGKQIDVDKLAEMFKSMQ
jgi:cytochrome bd-type quinol oxidase subunit 2